MVRVHSVRFDLPLFAAVLNPLRPAPGAKGVVFSAQDEEHLD
jgi:hypothetical protein